MRKAFGVFFIVIAAFMSGSGYLFLRDEVWIDPMTGFVLSSCMVIIGACSGFVGLAFFKTT